MPGGSRRNLPHPQLEVIARANAAGIAPEEVGLETLGWAAREDGPSIVRGIATLTSYAYGNWPGFKVGITEPLGEGIQVEIVDVARAIETLADD